MINWWEEMAREEEEKWKKDQEKYTERFCISSSLIGVHEEILPCYRDIEEKRRDKDPKYIFPQYDINLPIIDGKLQKTKLSKEKEPALDISSSLIGVNSNGDPIKFIPMEISIPNSPPLPFPCLSWDQYFLSIANVVKLRSKDAQTKVGSILVNSEKRIVATGYNSFPAAIDDSQLPTERPLKYPYMIHSEENSVCNLTTAERNLKLYCTGFPCHRCAKILWNRGVRHWVIDPSTKIAGESEDDRAVIDLLVKNGLVIEELECEYELIKKV